jgi:REP-associated tyrosine transposase
MPDWPHAPVHRLGAAGAYMVTAGTYQKAHYFREPDRLTLLHDQLLSLALRYGWQLQAWAVFSNHYHFIALTDEGSMPLHRLTRHLHSVTARAVNDQDGAEGRKVWFEFWDTHLTFERSYLARLQYVHQNAVRHGLVQTAVSYPWCSAAWIEQRAAPALLKTLASFRIDRVQVPDEWEAEPAD